ncbi:hypothetical protein TWF191_009981 [Orbilia oligospora]|uniref:Uncharacterized protein n=1 Tax=Orbilia oligospora TaxID=2813651 RepID=A0A7C8QJ38_ORBOL|nr:hypothetical protein TWF679_005738 [Orbilia oligospora]KAF3213683.1 hypothetical protein TWF191_009981 [Orbilia oligospora]
MVASVGAVNPIQEWSIEYKPYWFDTIKLLKSPIAGILRIMDDYHIDTEYCPISEEEDVLGTGESLERYSIILQRILPIFNETLPDISQNSSEIDLRVWEEVRETISAYLQVLKRLYPEMVSAGLWLARIPSYNYVGNNFETQEQALLCLIVNCTYYDILEKPLQKSEIEARYTVGFDEGAQQKFVDAVEEIWVKFELHLNIIDSLAGWEEKLGLSNFSGLKSAFSELDGLEKFEKTLKLIIFGIDGWMRCRSSVITSLREALQKFPSVEDIAEEMSRDL